MPVNITDVNDAIMLAISKQKKLIDEAFDEFYKPMQQTAMAITMKNIPPSVQAKLKELAPDAMASISKKLKL